jgi:hypothetical protein
MGEWVFFKYQNIIANHTDGTYSTKARPFCRDFTNNKSRTEKAKLLYEKIIFNHEDSIYLIEGRKYSVRGDTNI